MGYWPSRFGQDGWILAKFFFCVFMDRDEVTYANRTRKKRMRPISSNLDRTSLVNRAFIKWDKTPKNDLWSCGTKGEIPSGQDSSVLPSRVANHSAGFGSSCPLTDLVLQWRLLLLSVETWLISWLWWPLNVWFVDIIILHMPWHQWHSAQ